MAKVFTITDGLENMGALRSGGQGSVYKGRRIGPIITAVKLLPTPIHSESEDDKNFKNFHNEVEKLKKVNLEPNPNVVKILNYGITESGSLPFIEMEYIEGPELEELIKEPNEPIFTIKETIKLADQLACALMHCHKAGVRHGDIKGNNVKFNNHTGNYVLLDFGLAVMSDEQRRTSLRNAGAIEFMAPEQNDGIMLFQTDVYSYGVILYELLAGEVPFPLNDQSETARNLVRVAHLERPIPDLLETRKAHLPAEWTDEKKELEMQVPEWLLAIIYKCLQKLPDDRYADGIALQEALSYHQTLGNSNLLLAENKRLQELVLTYEQQPAPFNTIANDDVYNGASSSSVKMSSLVFTGLLILLASSLAFSCYLLFNNKGNRNVTQVVRDTILKPDTTKNVTIPVEEHPKEVKVKDTTKIDIVPAKQTESKPVVPQQVVQKQDSTEKPVRDTSKLQPDNQ